MIIYIIFIIPLIRQLYQLDFSFLDNIYEMSIVALVDLKGLPSVITQQADRPPSMRLLAMEMFNSIIGHSLFTKEALFLELMQRLNGLIASNKMQQYRDEIEKVKTYLAVNCSRYHMEKRWII